MTPDELTKALEKLRKEITEINDPIFPKPKRVGSRIKKSIDLSKELEEATQSIINAHKLYQEKGFDVEIRICSRTGLISKWNLKSKYPMRTGLVPAKVMHYEEFRTILNRLNDVFSSRDIHKALIESNIGPRRIQPMLGFIIKGLHGESPIEKVPGVDKGPGVRYRKVK
jgi:hypothetical protein